MPACTMTCATSARRTPTYFRSVRGQISRLFLVPAIVGTGLIWAFYMMIMYFNSDPYGFTSAELAGITSCAAMVAGVSVLLYAVYRITRRSVCRRAAYPFLILLLVCQRFSRVARIK